jgi:hypothetical protein
MLLAPAIVAGAFALVGLFGPLVEELAKAVGVSLGDPLNRARAWRWGVMVGAGFGVAEALAFGAMGAQLPAWPLNMTVRALTTLMHATVGGLGGLGVYELVAGQRRRGSGLILLAWILHAAWNSLVLLFTFAGLVVASTAPAAVLEPAAGDSGLAVAAACVTPLAAGALVLLFVLITLSFRYLSARAALDPGPVAVAPFGSGPAPEPAALPPPAAYEDPAQLPPEHPAEPAETEPGPADAVVEPGGSADDRGESAGGEAASGQVEGGPDEGGVHEGDVDEDRVDEDGVDEDGVDEDGDGIPGLGRVADGG